MESARPSLFRSKLSLDKLHTFLSRPVSAAVVDIFRILVGLLVSAYYVRLFLEYPLYTSESGFLDHELHRKLFWFTELTLFFPGSPAWYKLGILGLGALGALALTLGVRPKLGAVICWLVAVSVHRWNFAVINVDDSTITLLLWWMLFLPIGHTLTLDTLRKRSNWREEVFLTVDGFFVRALFANLFIYYLTAGLTKLASPLWREGLALFVVLQLPLARTNGWWGAEDLPVLWLGNHFTLIMEPLFPFLLFLPKGHWIKYLGGAAWFVFHLAIPVTIGVPYANLGLILALVLVFERELSERLKRAAGEPRESRMVEWRTPAGSKPLIVTYLLVLTLAMQKNVPVLEHVWEPAMAVLYVGGVAQEYHLFDWIDRFNWTLENTVTVSPEGGAPFRLDSDKLFPASVRGFIVQSYLLPMRWMRVPQPLTGEMRNSVLKKSAERLVRRETERLGGRGTISVESRVGRLDKSDLTGERLWNVSLMVFEYEGARVRFLHPKPWEQAP